MTLDELTAAPRQLSIAGRRYTVGPLELREWGQLQAWLKDNGLSPLRSIAGDLEGLGEADRKFLLTKALEQQRRWPPRVATDEWFDAISAAGGDSQFLLAVLRKHQPDMTPEEAERIARTATPQESLDLIYLAIGIEPPPKSQAPAATKRPTPGPKPKGGGRRSSTTGGGSSTP